MEAPDLSLIRDLGIFSEEQVDAFADLTCARADDLASLETALVAAAAQAHADEDVERLTVIVASVESVRAEIGRRGGLIASLLRRVSGPEPEPQPEPEPMSAAARRPSLAAINARKPQSVSLPSGVNQPRVEVVTAAGRRISSAQELTSEFIERMRGIAGTRAGKGSLDRLVVATFRGDYPADRRLGNDAALNMPLVAAVASPEAIIASGGLCAPVSPRYELANISQAGRPVRDSALAQFNADRGGIRFIPPTRFSEFSGGVEAWTEAIDANPGANVKNCATVSCETETEVVIEAITRCLQFGNLGARAFPEQVQDAIEKVMAWRARFAERRLLASIGTNSTAVSAGQVLGFARDVLENMDQAAAAYRARHRTLDDMPLRVILPAWARSAVRADMTRQIPGDDAMAKADAEIARFFAVRNINVTWAFDQVTAALEFSGDQNAGGLNPWPTEIRAYLYHEGAFLFLDGGTLDLGIVRDSDLNSTNDFQVFAETFETAAFVGLESIQLTMDVCVSGKTSAAEDVEPCTLGS